MSFDNMREYGQPETSLLELAQVLLENYAEIKDITFPNRFVKIVVSDKLPGELTEYVSAIEHFLNAPIIVDVFEDHNQRREFRKQVAIDNPRLHRLLESNKLRVNHLNLVNLYYLYPNIFTLAVPDDVINKMQNPEISSKWKADALHNYLIELLNKMQEEGYIDIQYL